MTKACASQTKKEFGCVRLLCVADFSESINNNTPKVTHAALGIVLRLLCAKSSTTFQSLYAMKTNYFANKAIAYLLNCEDEKPPKETTLAFA